MKVEPKTGKKLHDALVKGIKSDPKLRERIANDVVDWIRMLKG